MAARAVGAGLCSRLGHERLSARHLETSRQSHSVFGRVNRTPPDSRSPQTVESPQAGQGDQSSWLSPAHVHCGTSPQGVQLGFSLGMRVLHRNARAELHVRARCGAKRLVIGHPRRAERGHLQFDETVALGLGDLQTSTNVDQVLKTELTREAVRATEALGCGHRQVIDVLRLAPAEQRLQQRIAQNTVVENSCSRRWRPCSPKTCSNSVGIIEC